jgi:hypothetical protein
MGITVMAKKPFATYGGERATVAGIGWVRDSRCHTSGTPLAVGVHAWASQWDSVIACALSSGCAERPVAFRAWFADECSHAIVRHFAGMADAINPQLFAGKLARGVELRRAWFPDDLSDGPHVGTVLGGVVIAGAMPSVNVPSANVVADVVADVPSANVVADVVADVVVDVPSANVVADVPSANVVADVVADDAGYSSAQLARLAELDARLLAATKPRKTRKRG